MNSKNKMTSSLDSVIAYDMISQLIIWTWFAFNDPIESFPFYDSHPLWSSLCTLIHGRVIKSKWLSSNKYSLQSRVSFKFSFVLMLAIKSPLAVSEKRLLSTGKFWFLEVCCENSSYLRSFIWMQANKPSCLSFHRCVCPKC